MNNTISVYDLLGLIKDGKAPKKIKYEENIYDYNEVDKDYQKSDGRMLLGNIRINYCFNSKVEIVDYEKWKQIADFPNYEISTKGNIRTKERLNNKNDIKKSKL